MCKNLRESNVLAQGGNKRIHSYNMTNETHQFNNNNSNNNNNNNNNNYYYYYYYYLLQLGCYPVAVVILHVNKT